MSLIFYQDYVSYNMRPNDPLSRPPGSFACCPMCSGLLSQSNVEPSQMVAETLSSCAIPYHEYTRRFACSKCNWWCIRELWTDLEYMGVCDDLITGIAKRWDWSGEKTTFSILQEHFKHRRGPLANQHFSIEVVRKITAEYSRNEHRSCEAHYIGNTNGRWSGDGVYLMQDDEQWMIVIVDQGLNTDKESIRVVDLLNGVFLSEGNPIGMVITSTELELAQKLKSTSVSGVLDTVTLKRELREARRTYRVFWEQGDIILGLLEKTSTQYARQPWLKALNDERVYDDQLNFPEEIGLAFGESKEKCKQLKS